MTADRHGERPRQGGVPDGLILGVLGLLLTLTALVWTSTGLAALFAHGSWPAGVTFTHSPEAIRSLATAPQDIAAAWPRTRPDRLSGYGLVWGLLIGQLLTVLVLAVFLLGTVTRARAVRASRRAQARAGARSGHRDDHHDRTAPEATAPPAAPAETDKAPRRPPAEKPREDERTAPDAAEAVVPPPPVQPGRPAPVPPLTFAPPQARRAVALRAVERAPGPALVLTSDPTLWEETRETRAELGPVLLYDPTHRTDATQRLHWSPTSGCEEKHTAAARATALLAPVRPTAKLDAAVADTAETLLRSWLHAAAVGDRPFKHVHRWAQGADAHEPVTILRTRPGAAAGTAGELESALTAHTERREIAQQLTAHALAAHSTLHIREACTPNRTDSLSLASFISGAGTLYVVGEPIEDPRTHPGAMPMLTALTASVVEHGRRMAARSTDGRLDPPITLILDDVAAVAPIPQLPDLLHAVGRPHALPVHALLRSREQARARWPHTPLPEPAPDPDPVDPNALNGV